MSKGASSAPQEISMHFAVLPALSLNLVWLALFQLVEHQVHRIFEVLIVLTHLHRIDKLNERGEILFLHRRFIVDVPDKGGVEQRFRL